MKSTLLFTIVLLLLSSCVQTAYPRNYIISHIPAEEKDAAPEEDPL